MKFGELKITIRVSRLRSFWKESNEIGRRVSKKNQFKGLLVGRSSVEISILWYADHTIFFGEASMQNVRVIKAMLRSFEIVTSLKINFA